MRSRRELGVVLAARCDQIREERDPVAVFLVHPVPERPEAGPAGEVGEERRLAVAGVGDHEHDAVVDLDVEPVEQAVARQRLLAERRALDLADLDRVAAHTVARCPSQQCRRADASAPVDRAGGAATPRHLQGLDVRRIGRRERYGAVEDGVNHGK